MKNISPSKRYAEQLSLCAFCGKNTVRRTKTMLSKYCSEKCAKESHALANSKMNAARKAKNADPLAMFTVPGVGEFDWRSAQMNPMG